MKLTAKIAGTVLLAAATFGAAPAGATGAVVNHVPLPQGTNMSACLQRAAMAIAAVGLRPLNTTQSAAWGEREGGRIFSVYCIPAHSVAIVMGAGNSSAEVSPDVTALRDALRRGHGGGGGGSRK